MPFVRCRFYTENGEPVRGGCRRKSTGSCAFVHPEDPNWDSAPPATFRARDKGGDPGGPKTWNGKRDATTTSTWDAGGSPNTITTDTGPGWSAVSGWGDGSGWGTGGGWSATGSTSTMNQDLAPVRSDNSSGTTSRDVSAPANERNQGDASSTADEHTRSSERGWGGSANNNATGSGWRGAGNSGWGATSRGNRKDADKITESGWGSTGNDGWGASGWGNDKDADKTVGSGWGSTANNGWGVSSWGDNKDTTKSWEAPDPMVVDNQAEKETERSKRKGKTVPAPPRIRIPDNEHKKHKVTGTNNEPLGSTKWGEPRCSMLTPVTASTPITTAMTPTDPPRLKRKRDVAFDDKLDVFKEYVKAWERGVRTRFLLAEAEAKRDRWFRTQKSACYARIGEAGRKKLDGERAECDKEVNMQREKLSGAITTLVNFHDQFSSKLDLGQRYSIGEQAEKFIVESKAFVDEVRRLLVEHVLKDKSDVHLGDNPKQPSGVTNATSTDLLRNQVRDLEQRFDQAQTELTLRRQRDVRPEIDELLTAKIAALRVARQREIDHVASQPHPEIVIPPGGLEKIEGTTKQVRELDAKVPRTVEDIRVLLLRVDATTKRVSELEEELSANRATYNKQVQQMAVEKEEMERRMDQRLEKIREQFDQLIASQPPSSAEQPAMSPIHDSREKLVESLRPAFEAVLEKFYKQEVQPTIESLQRVVVQASDRHQEDAIKVLWGMIQPAMNMVADVSRWLDSQELSVTAPIEADHA